MYEHFPKQNSEKDFAEKILNISHDYLKKIEQSKIDNAVYKKLTLKKKKGGYRVVYKVTDEKISSLYKALNLKLSLYFAHKIENFPHKSVYGYIKNRNILENALPHCQKKRVMKIDICDFFNSISQGKIADKLELIGKLNANVAKAMAAFVCIEQRFPLGLHTSPLISNIICWIT